VNAKSSRATLFGVIVLSVGMTWAVFGQTRGYDFVNYDDRVYVAENPQIQAGLTWQNVIWAFTHVHSNNWHPLTTMSHMFDCQFFGLNPGAHHLVNVALHIANVVLLFLLLQQLTASVWSSAFVAALFAIHPLHVESVAWVSERKDVLSGLFFFLTVFAYLRYTRKPGIARYITMSIFFVCGLLSKPMLVTLPAILLLLDYWPLGRFRRSTVTNLVLEKIPLLVLSIGSAIATLIAQRGAIVEIEHFPLSWRAANALSVYLIYIWQMIWPAKLATIYPHPGRLPVWETIGAGALLGLITIAVLFARKQRPYLMSGWLWYLIMLVPVIGLVQVGSQGHADRYTYLPQIGLYIAVTWSIVDVSKSVRYRYPAFAVAGSVIIALFAWRASIQTAYWHDSERLWNRTLAVTKQNDVAHFMFGQFLLKTHRLAEAIAQFQIVLIKNPFDPYANFQIGSAFVQEGEFDAAAEHFERTLKVQPENTDAETNLANTLLESGHLDEAVEHYRNVVGRESSSALVHYNLAVCLHQLGQLPEAIAHYKEALRIEPGYPDADRLLERALLQKRQLDEAKLHLEKQP